MMGPYYYYDTTFIEDVYSQTDSLHIHDCMWSGECYTCQSNSSFMSGPPLTQLKTIKQQTRAIKPQAAIPATPAAAVATVTATTTTKVIKPPQVKTERKHSSASTAIKLAKHQAKTSSRINEKRNVPSNNNANAAISHSSSRQNYTITTDNKKLRHREVEKNRHRQLQAMVKTLSDQIPGKLDKETQVQTMKRAARYCIFLREACNLLTSTSSLGAPNGNDGANSNLKEKLEVLYLKSCDNVDSIMSRLLPGRLH